MNAEARHTLKASLDDPRTIRTVRRALKWCDLHLSDWRPREIYENSITEAFGPNIPGRTGRWLREKLLRRVHTYVAKKSAFNGVTARPCSYILNREGYDELLADFGPLDDSYSDVFPKYAKELRDLEFEYALKSSRYWHGLQNLRREKKPIFWSKYGLVHDYDIAAAAPTILLTLASGKGLHRFAREPIEQYLQNKRAFREHVASVAGISYEEAKRLINSFFNGAALTQSKFCTAFRELGPHVVEKLQNDKPIRRLRVAIRALWRSISRGEIREVERNGVRMKKYQRTAVRKAKDKWAIYFENELKVMNVIRSFLDVRGVKHFDEHDGFRTNQRIDISALEAAIEEQTGFKLTIEEETGSQFIGSTSLFRNTFKQQHLEDRL